MNANDSSNSQNSNQQKRVMYDRFMPVQPIDQLQAFSTATTYFNTRLHTSSVEERILAYLISGITLKNLKKFVKKKLVSGIHPSITISALNKFEHRYGTSPDAFQLANPNPYGKRKGYFSEPEPITFVGQEVECDFMEPDFNDVKTTTKPEKRTSSTKSLDDASGTSTNTKTKQSKTHKVNNNQNNENIEEEGPNPKTQVDRVIGSLLDPINEVQLTTPANASEQPVPTNTVITTAPAIEIEPVVIRND